MSGVWWKKTCVFVWEEERVKVGVSPYSFTPLHSTPPYPLLSSPPVFSSLLVLHYHTHLGFVLVVHLLFLSFLIFFCGPSLLSGSQLSTMEQQRRVCHCDGKNRIGCEDRKGLGETLGCEKEIEGGIRVKGCETKRIGTGTVSSRLSPSGPLFTCCTILCNTMQYFLTCSLPALTIRSLQPHHSDSD